MSLREATVVEILESRPDLQKVRVSTAGTIAGESSILAFNYLELGPELVQGQRVLVNTTGIDLGLGTGSTAFVLPAGQHFDAQSFGHIIKLRYTPLQIPVDSVEEQDSPSHELLQEARSIHGMPVVCCELHSQMPLVAAALKQRAPEARLVYLMNDAAALPVAFSELACSAKQAGLIDNIISSGQAFGGDLEAINTYSALLAAKHVCKAACVIVAPGPGIAGTNTTFGHSGIAQGEALNATTSLEGTPIAVLRLSWRDARERHRGLSHHSATVLAQVCLAPVIAPLPNSLPAKRYEEVLQQLLLLGTHKGHEQVLVELPQEGIDLRGIKVRTMGRSQAEDPEFFDAAFAAGLYAAQVLHAGSLQ